MNLSKQHWIIIGIFAIIVVWYLFLNKKDIKKESGYASPRKRSKRILTFKAI